MKLKMPRNAHNISPHKNYDFYYRCLYVFIIMTTQSYHRLIRLSVNIFK